MGLRQHQAVIRVDTRQKGQGLLDITRAVDEVVGEAGFSSGVCHVFVQHTSCSLVIQENADPSARHDLEQWIARLAPENDPAYTHTLEGADDMPAHLRSSITNSSEQIPICDGRLGLGSWQGLFLWEHRRRGHTRRLVVILMGQ